MSRKRHLIYLCNQSDSRDITLDVFQYGVDGHFWAAILDLKVKMVSENGKNYFIISIQINLTNLVLTNMSNLGAIS